MATDLGNVSGKKLEVGDVVVLLEREQEGTLGKFPLGKVIEVCRTDGDGLVRQVLLQIGKKTFRRNITSVMPLELNSEELDVPNWDSPRKN